MLGFASRLIVQIRRCQDFPPESNHDVNLGINYFLVTFKFFYIN